MRKLFSASALAVLLGVGIAAPAFSAADENDEWWQRRIKKMKEAAAEKAGDSKVKKKTEKAAKANPKLKKTTPPNAKDKTAAAKDKPLAVKKPKGKVIAAKAEPEEDAAPPRKPLAKLKPQKKKPALQAALKRPNSGVFLPDDDQIGGLFGGKVKQNYNDKEVIASRGEKPTLTGASAGAMETALARYSRIVADGGWPKVPNGKFRVGSQNEAVAALKRRLHIEGYVNSGAIDGETGFTFTAGTAEAVKLFQTNHGLAATGKVDKATLAALNVPARGRLQQLRANVERVAAYSEDLGGRYIVVNIPALTLETVSGGKVFSKHRIIAGRTDRPSPVVMTKLSDVNFNPYWNAPASIVAKDLIPDMRKKGVKTLRDQNIRVLDGINGPEVDPSEIEWESTDPERYHFRQDPGNQNAMATAKINFASPFGVYMHDTPAKSLFKAQDRYLSSGCVRVDKIHVMLNWVLNGQDGLGSGAIDGLARSKERLDVKLGAPPQLRWVYLTAWATPNAHVNFRKDIYELDGTGFVYGQPMPVGEFSEDGERYMLKPPVSKPLWSVEDGAVAGYSGSGDDGEPVLKKRKKRTAEVAPIDDVEAPLKKKPKKVAAAAEDAEPPKKKPKKAGVLSLEDAPPKKPAVKKASTDAEPVAVKKKKRKLVNAIEGGEPE